MEAVRSDHTERIPLKDQLEKMNRKELEAYADTVGYKVDGRVKDATIIEAMLKSDSERKKKASDINEESLRKVVDKNDPEILVIFNNAETANADLEFCYSEPRGMFGPENPNGYKKMPKYHLFPGERVKLPYSVYEHLSNLTFRTNKVVWKDGQIAGNEPIIKPRFILQVVVSKEQAIKLNE